jgi:hypothetical protein
MRQLRRTATALTAAVVALTMTSLAGCAAPAYTYAADTSDHAYFKVPSGWHEVSPKLVSDAQQSISKTAAGSLGGKLVWSRAYTAATDLPASRLLADSPAPVVYASVQVLRDSLRAQLSFDQMRDLFLAVTPQARQVEENSLGAKLPPYKLLGSVTIATTDGVRGITEQYVYALGGLPVEYLQTVLTNSATTKVYLLLVQCLATCFSAHAAQIETVAQSFTVRGS